MKRDVFRWYGTRQRLFLFAVVMARTLALMPQLGAQQRPTAIILRVGMLTGSSSGPAQSAERGVRLGVAEAKQTAQLFGGDVQLFESPLGSDPVGAATRLVSANSVQVLVVTDPLATDAISKFAEQRRLIFLNIAAREQSLRAACRRYTFHVEASDAMYGNAARRSSRKAGPTNSSDDRDSVVLWWQTLERYGAGQINDRYRARYNTGMDGPAWAGWAAVKMIAESALRARSVDAPRLIAYLESPTTTFDGHKGWPLTFRTADHQLRQPLYVLTHDKQSGKLDFHDVPELRSSRNTGTSEGGSSASAALDALIAPPNGPRCQWSTSP